MTSRFLREILLGKKKSLYCIDIKKELSNENSKGFLHNIDGERANIIAEIKKASPSRGIINERLDIAGTALIYDSFSSFVSGISVLTEEIYFKGEKGYILQAATGTSLPILRKDFIFSWKQVYESAVLGADCILLIKPLLGIKKLRVLYKYALNLGLDVLVEVHSKEELLQILDMGADLIGINNRDLKTMKVDNDHIISVLKDIPPDIIREKTIVCESGIDSVSYIEKLYGMGVGTFLIGSYFMDSQDLEETLSCFGRDLKERGLI